MGPLAILLIALCYVVSIIYESSQARQARQLLESWAKDNGYQILRSELRWLRRGPFFWTTSRNQKVYYVSVRDRAGVTRNGWVRISKRRGVIRYKAEVMWDK